MTMHCWLDIDGAALRQNYQVFAALLGTASLAPVLKSNAYGHGLQQVYAALAPLAPAWLAVNYTAEGSLLRQWGFRGRILVVGPILPEDIEVAAGDELEVIIGNPIILRAWLERKRKPRIHIKIDTGMGRQGFLVADMPPLVASLLPYKAVVVGLCTHFANVEDVSDTSYAELQLERFTAAQALFAAGGYRLLCHSASSASALILPHSRLDLCRIGISLYGLWPSRMTRLSFLKVHKELAQLTPALSWRSRLTTVRDVQAGEFIGYGCTFKAPRPMRLGVVAVGYYEGYPRLASSHGRSYVLVQGQRCAIVGRICMNMMMVDVTGLDHLALGEVVTLIGTDGEERVSAEDLADWAQSINYEVVSRLCATMPRRLLASP